MTNMLLQNIEELNTRRKQAFQRYRQVPRTFLPAYLPSCPPTYLPNYLGKVPTPDLPTFLSTYLPA
eukprot:1497212-Rhodomonas_salina.1